MDKHREAGGGRRLPLALAVTIWISGSVAGWLVVAALMYYLV